MLSEKLGSRSRSGVSALVLCPDLSFLVQDSGVLRSEVEEPHFALVLAMTAATISTFTTDSVRGKEGTRSTVLAGCEGLYPPFRLRTKSAGEWRRAAPDRSRPPGRRWRCRLAVVNDLAERLALHNRERKPLTSTIGASIDSATAEAEEDSAVQGRVKRFRRAELLTFSRAAARGISDPRAAAEGVG